MTEHSKKKPQAEVSREGLRDERQQRGDATTPAPADQLGATEHDVTPLTPPTSEKPAKKASPGATTKQKAEEEIDPADELTPG